ncbi:MAG: TdeIII family type II restriction endonuclease [Boseongicola sp. SB0662_bin_57]|nr:TdeIII family type II restriction endonuclease [Boseongicola sp. SB0662_bin_57]
MIAEKTRQHIKGYLEGFLQRMVEEKLESGFDPKELRPPRQESPSGNLKPFHESLLPDGLLSITEFERSFSTKLGTTFEEVARLIASDNHRYAERGRRVEGFISLKAIKRIEEIVSEIGSGGMHSRYRTFVKEILGLTGDGEQVERTSIADLYIKKEDNTELYIEIKSPKPNKGQCLEATGRLLQIHGITYKQYPKVEAYFASAYNPWGIAKSTYSHSFSINYMDLKNEVLIGKEFWELVGGAGTYEEVL